MLRAHLVSLLAFLGLVLVVPGRLIGDEKTAAALKPDPAATKLLAEARAARAVWENFPGFSADIEVNLDGQVSRGQVHVDVKGKARYEGLTKPAETWVRPVLGSILNHRLDSGASDTPCAFIDQEENHPLGRSIRLLDDDMQSRYAIRDKQIMVVDRVMGGKRFVITTQENHANAEGKYLPASFQVTYWDLATGELIKSEGHHQNWQRFGRFDLPVSSSITTANKTAATALRSLDPGKEVLSTKTLALTHHKLAEGTR